MKQLSSYAFCWVLLFFTACSGVKTENWPNGNIKSEITTLHNQRNGPAKYWYEDGTLQMECTYKNNRLEGSLIRYYLKGFKEEQQKYKNDSLNGPGLFWDRLGNLVIETNYLNGKLHGNYREFYPNKQIKSEGFYIKGNIDGQWLYYNEFGQVIGLGNFHLGNGVQRSFYPENGKVKILTNYKNNLKEGSEIEYSPEGREIIARIFSKGNLIEEKTIPAR